jgi:SSS family solute:Na+ symporter
VGVYTRWFNSWALLLGWAVGTFVGTWMAFAVNLVNTYPLTIAGHVFPVYTAFFTVLLNLVVTIILTPVFNAMSGGGVPVDETVEADYQTR